VVPIVITSDSQRETFIHEWASRVPILLPADGVVERDSCGDLRADVRENTRR
jgi:hypothetical protein